MKQISVINNIIVPAGMEEKAETIRAEYVKYFSRKEGFVSSTFYKSHERETDGSIKYINIIVWASISCFEQVVNEGFTNVNGENSDGMRVLGKGFPKPIIVSPGIYRVIEHNA